MSEIKKYKTKNGATRYKYRTFIGRDKQGKQVTQSKQGFKTRKEAQLALNQVTTERLTKGVNTISTKLSNQDKSFSEVYQEWFNQYKYTVKESTSVTTARIFKLHIIPTLGSLRLAKITPEVIQNLVNMWYSTPLKQYKRFTFYTSSIFKYAIKKDYIFSNPVTKIDLPQNKKVPNLSIENFYDKQELMEFLQCMKDMDNPQAYTFFRLLAFSGLRKGEALALTWNDIDLVKGTVSINKTQSYGEHGYNIQTPKTINSYRTVFIDNKTTSILANWRNTQASWLKLYQYPSQGSKQLVFSNQKNNMFTPVKPLTWLNRCIDKYSLKHITVHGFRHTYATLAFEAGMDIKQVQTQLGHSNIKTTLEIYTAVTKSKQSDIAKKYSNYLDF